ncbi:MAG: hypothetical protein AABX12_00435 [Nanoarchaeota archaeon]
MLLDSYGDLIGVGLIYCGSHDTKDKTTELYYTLGVQTRDKITDFMAINAEGREIQITPELAKKLHPVSDSALIAAIHAGMINPGYIPWCEEKAGIKINLKPIKNEEKKKAIPLEDRLTNLLTQWAKDSRTLVPDKSMESAGSARPILNELSEAFNKIDSLICEYEIATGESPDLCNRFPRDEVYEAGRKACKEINARWEEIFERAKEKRFLDDYQIETIKGRDNKPKTQNI